MDTLLSAEAMSGRAAAWKREGLTIGFVPTMGFLHRGHVSLMEALRPRVDRLVVSIYVNPLQFGPKEDLGRYPRDPEGDSQKCAAVGVDALFMPENLYPSGFSTSVEVSGLTERLCGAFRPGHFEGVATVCTRLFGLTRADVAILGEKDYQQLQVVRRLVRDLALPVEIVGGELIRDEDGLALSSRNVYLSPDERKRALTLSKAMRAMASGGGDVEARLALGRSILDVDKLDYLEIVDPDTLQPATDLSKPTRAVIAAFVGKTRLLDNVAVAAV